MYTHFLGFGGQNLTPSWGVHVILNHLSMHAQFTTSDCQMSDLEPKEELYNYLFKLSGVRASVLTFLAGFTFTVLSIFLNQLPDPTNSMSQITLFLLTLLFEFFLFLSAWQMTIIISCAPARIVYAAYGRVFRREVATFSLLMFLGLSLFGMSVMLMFLLWNLFYLALASSVIWILFVIAAYSIIRKNIKRIRALNE